MTSTLARGLRLAADLLDKHPSLPTPYITSVTDIGIELNWYLTHDEDTTGQRETRQRIIRTLGGSWDEKASGTNIVFTRGDRYSDPLSLTILVDPESVAAEAVAE